MSLPIYQRVAVTDAGDVIPGAEYTVINENTGVAAPIYSDRTGATLLSAPYFADSVGTIQFFIAQGTTFRVAASGGVGTYTDRYVYGVAEAVLVQADGSATINRVGSDGVLLDLKKDGTALGSIGIKSGALLVESATCGLWLNGSSDLVIATDGNGSGTNGAMDLGSSGNRFKDLYLSGGVVFGDAGGTGTNTSNTLDSYEEGTWTPTGAGVTVPYTCYYTKIGRQVNCKGYVGTTVSVSSFGGLPFSFTGSTGARSSGTAAWNNFTSNVMSILHAGTGTNFAFYVGSAAQTITAGKIVYFDLTYYTNQ